MTDPRASDLTAPLLSAEETYAHKQHAPTHHRADDVAPHGPFGPGKPGNLVVTPESSKPGSAMVSRQANAPMQFAARVLAQVESQDVLLTELRKVVAEIAALAQGSENGAIARLAQTADEAVSFCGATLLEIEAEGRRAAQGIQAVDGIDAVHDVLHDLACAGWQRVAYVGGRSNYAVWANVPSLFRAIRLAIQLVDARIDGEGAIQIEVGDDEQGHFLRIVGSAKRVGEPSKDLVEEFREAVESAGLRVTPDEQTHGRSGFVLRLPLSARGPLLPLA